MKKIGLALSGGGFRATLYHLGVLRFLRDAGILHQVTHITSVSGGSIMAAHLVLNWHQYTGSPKDFDQAAAKLLDFIRRDVRNRIVRRYPLGLLLLGPRRLLGLSNRQLSRTGWLENQYETLLYGDKSLFELPERPLLHILTTNLSEGCLCSFNRDGLWKMVEKAGREQIERQRVGLMTVAMAVTASSAFPGFFPPLELTGHDVGARGGEFGRQWFTDGGVFDNLGVRMFRWLTPLLTGEHALDGVLVSDVGQRIAVQSATRGLIRAALRSSDILMDRVWQLEIENFQDTFGFVFARIIDVVNHDEDATALHPEVQRQSTNIRTDLDGFSNLEMSCLIRHGYCIARKTCRSRADLFGSDLPKDPPWDPIPPASLPQSAPPDASGADTNDERSPSTILARELQTSASRRIWSRLLNIRDWTSYIYMPLIPLLLLTPYFLIDSYYHARQIGRLVEAVSQGSPDFDVMSQLIRGPMRTFKGEPAQEMSRRDPPDYKNFIILQDARILDLRPWDPTEAGKSAATSLVYGYRRLKVQKAENSAGKDVLRLPTLATHPDTRFRFPPQRFPPTLQRLATDKPGGHDPSSPFEVRVDLSKAPAGQLVDVSFEHYSAGAFVFRGEISSTAVIPSEFDAADVTHWFLMPRGREYRSYQILRYETGKPGTAELVKGLTEHMTGDASILAYKMASVKAGYTFEVTWFYK